MEAGLCDTTHARRLSISAAGTTTADGITVHPVTKESVTFSHDDITTQKENRISNLLNIVFVFI